MGFFAMLIIGAIAGFIASYVMKSPQGIVMDIILGVVGAFIGGFIMNLFGGAGVTGFNLYSIFVAFIGAVVIIALERMFFRRNRTI